MFHFVAVVKLGDRHAAKKKQPGVPQVAFKKPAPSTVAPSRALKRKEVPTPAPDAPSKEARVEHPPSPIAMRASSDVQIDTRLEQPESTGAEARVVEGTQQEVARAPDKLGIEDAVRVAQSIGGVRSKAVQAMGIINELVDVAERSQAQTAELEGRYQSLRGHHTRLKELSNQLRNSQKVWMTEIAAQKAKAEEAIQREAETEARAKQQIAAMVAETQKQTAEMKVEVQKQAAEIQGLQDQNKSLQEELALRKTEIAEAEQKMAELRSQQINQGDLCTEVVAKLIQTSGFGNWVVKLTDGSVELGRNLVLQELMEACPELRLRKSELGWDPEAVTRANLLQQRLFKAEPDFELLKELQKLPHPLTLEEIKELKVDYDVDLDKDLGTVADNPVCEDDGLPYIVPVPNSVESPIEPAEDNNPPTSTSDPVEEAS